MKDQSVTEDAKDLEKYQNRQPAVIPPAEMTQQESFFASVERLAMNPDVDVAKIKQIMDMQEHILDRKAKQVFNISMVEVQKNIPIVPKDKINNGTKPPSKYSSYEMIMKHCKPVYTAEGFAISAYEGTQQVKDEIFPPIPEGEVRIFGDVMHKGGWSKTYYVDIPLDDKGPQGTTNKTLPHAKKSSLSYGRSALMCMILNIPTGDADDGNAAGAKPGPKFTTEAQKKEIGDLFKTLGITDPEDIKSRLADRFEGITDLDEVFTESADILINALKKMVKKEGK